MLNDGTALEERRLASLRETGLLGTAPEPEFDEIVQLASIVCGAPISAMTLLDRESLFVKSAVGTPTGTMPREGAFCEYTVQSQQPFTVGDARADERFASSAYVTRDPGIRFYSGVPLQAEDGSTLGALCVLDTEPRELTEEQAWSLEVLGRQLSIRVQLRARMRLMEEQAIRIEEQRELMRLFLDSLPMEAYLKSDKGELLFYNRALADHFGIAEKEWLGKTSYDLMDREKADLIRTEEDYVLRTGERHESYAEVTMPRTGPEYWKLIKAPLRMQSGRQLLAAVAINLTPERKREAELLKLRDELEEANRKLRSLSLTDDLTGLWNRRAFDARLETEIFEAERSAHPLTLLLMDVDSFKSLNDSFGHCHGDAVLEEIGTVLRHAARSDDMAARYGGEEFALILPKTDVSGAQALCHRIAEGMRAVCWEHREVTLSIGIAPYRHGLTSDALLNMADEALYQAKHSGKDRAAVYQAEVPEPYSTVTSFVRLPSLTV